MLAFNLQPVQTPDMSHLTPSNIDTALRHAEGWPITVGFFSLVLILGGALYWLLFKFYPSWQAAQAQRAANMAAEAEKTRQHMSEVLTSRGSEAARDVKTISEAIGVKVDHIAKDIDDVEAMTRELSGKFSEVHNKVSGIHDILMRAVANKTSVVGLLLVLSGTVAYMGAWSCLPVRRGVAAAAGTAATGANDPTPCSATTAQKQCRTNNDCPVPQYCSGGVCVRNAASKDAPKQQGPQKRPDDTQATSQPHGGDLYRDYGEGGGLPTPYTVQWRGDEASPRWL